ncbi:MAG: ATP-grasp domain-containing protein [Promethearchaeia archaeon]
MTENKIFIFEFISGGGFNKEQIPSSLFCEGFAMLNAISADFSQLPFEVHTLLDERIVFLSNYLQIDQYSSVSQKDDYTAKFKKILSMCDACFIIAPEFSNILYDLTMLAKGMDKTILSVNPKGIELAGSKIKTSHMFEAYEIPTPKTVSLSPKNQNIHNQLPRITKELGFPIIIKPNDGVSAESLYVLENKKKLEKFLQSKKYLDNNREYVVQSYHHGQDLSASLILPLIQSEKSAVDRKSILLSINRQILKFKDISVDSEYFGGSTPVAELKTIAEKFLNYLNRLDLTPFQSYIGIDFIFTDDKKLSFIEVNPRLTTSYIGIRNVLEENPMNILLNPENYDADFILAKQKLRFSQFSRVELVYKGGKELTQIYNDLYPELLAQIPEFMTPPLSFKSQVNKKKIQFSSFLATRCQNHKKSRERMEEIEKILQEFGFYFH